MKTPTLAPDPTDLPEGWSYTRARFLCRIETGTADTIDSEEDGEYPFFVRSETVERSSQYTFDTEAVLTSGDGAGLGKIYHHYKGKFLAHQRVYVFSRFTSCIPRYFYYYLLSQFGPQVLAGTAKSTVESLRKPMLADFRIALPGKEKQKQIIEFLDRETAHIDAMIEAQIALASLLNERLRSSTNRAVFGRDNPSNVVDSKRDGESVRYTPGGGMPHLAIAPALTEVPDHWAVHRFKNCIRRIERRNEMEAAELMSLTSGGLIVPRAETGDRQQPAPESIPRYLLVRPGDLVVNPMWLIGGALGVSTRHGAVSPDYRVFTVDTHILEPRYVHHVLRSSPYRTQYTLFARANTTFDRRIQQVDLDNLAIPVPPLAEQRQIVRGIDETLSQGGTLIQSASTTVSLLRERREALISAAVTGRIDPERDLERADAVTEKEAS